MMLSGDGTFRNDESASQMGSVTSIEGSKVHLELGLRNGRPSVRVTVGNLVRIRAGGAILVGIVTTLASAHERGREPGAFASLDLLGQIIETNGVPGFCRGVTCYPAIGD